MKYQSAAIAIVMEGIPEKFQFLAKTVLWLWFCILEWKALSTFLSDDERHAIKSELSADWLSVLAVYGTVPLFVSKTGQKHCGV
jgi:hypothetical protein